MKKANIWNLRVFYWMGFKHPWGEIVFNGGVANYEENEWK